MGIIVQAICCFFSTLYRFPEVFIPSIICVCIIFFFHWKKRTFPHLKIIIFSAILSITFCFVLYLLGVLVNIQAPCDVIKTKGEFVILPRRERGDITMLTSNAERDVRLFGRPLASRGFKVRLITTEGGIGEIKRLSQLFSHKDIPKSILLATEPELALLAVAVGKNIPFACVATANMPNHWPFEELSPLNAKKCRNHLELPIDSPESIIKHLIIYNTIK